MLVLVIAAGLRLYRLSDESLCLDEFFTYSHIDEATLSDFLEAVQKNNSPVPPAYFVIEYCWANLVGKSVLSLRYLSIVISLITLLMVYSLGKALFDSVTGWLAALVWAMSRLDIYYAQEIRTYALLSLLAVISIYSLHMCLGDSRGRHWIWIHLVANTLLPWSHSFAAFLIAAEAIFLLIFYRHKRRFLVAWFVGQALIAASFVAWQCTNDMKKIELDMAWVRPCTWTKILCDNGMGILRGRSIPALNIIPVVLWVALGYFGYSLFKQSQHRNEGVSEPANHGPKNFVLLMLWFLVPTILLAAMSYFYRPCYISRYILYRSPALAILVAAAVTTTFRRNPVTGVVLVAILIGSILNDLSAFARPFRTNYRSVADKMAAEWKPGDRLVLVRTLDLPVFQYYCGLEPRFVTSLDNVDDAMATVHRAVNRRHRTWLMLHAAVPEAKVKAALPEDRYDVSFVKLDGPQMLLTVNDRRPDPPLPGKGRRRVPRRSSTPTIPLDPNMSLRSPGSSGAPVLTPHGVPVEGSAPTQTRRAPRQQEIGAP